MNFKMESYSTLFILIIFFISFSTTVESKDSSSSSASSSSSQEDSSELKLRLSIEETTVSPPSSEVSKSTMDIITVIWYLSTFLALAAFFFLMACSDRRCGRQRLSSESVSPSNLVCPPSPSPSYSEFAPPSYDSVMKKHQIFVVPIDYKIKNEKNEKLTDIQVHTKNKLQKY